MPSDMLDWVYKCLLEDEDVVVPLKKLWSRRYGLAGNPSFQQFARSVLRDERFEEMYSLDHDPLLEDFGYFAGPRVKLRSRELTGQCIFRLVQQHNERVVEVLRRALEVLSEEPQADSEEDLNDALILLEGLRPIFKPWIHLKPKDQPT